MLVSADPPKFPWCLGWGDRHARCGMCMTLQVIADGLPVPLPAGTQGVLVLNIGSFMGGVPLWAGSYGPDQPPDSQQEPAGTAELGAGSNGMPGPRMQRSHSSTLCATPARFSAAVARRASWLCRPHRHPEPSGRPVRGGLRVRSATSGQPHGEGWAGTDIAGIGTACGVFSCLHADP
jgi:hypothetical protein